MASTTTFGDGVIAQAETLKQNGLDANQIAGILCKRDPQGNNYGIGIVLGSDGKPLPTSPTLLAYASKEIAESGSGSYLNSDALKKELLDGVLGWQGVPDAYTKHFQLLLPSDAGTGAVQTAIQAAAVLKEGLSTIAVEELGWPAYKTIAGAARLGYQEFATDGAASGTSVLPLYQAGPMNTTGRVPSAEVIRNRVQAASKNHVPVVLDRAYSGFEFARQLGEWTYSEVMKRSFQNQILPFIEAGVPFALAISPTKAFVTFALRPCGLLLIYHPDPAQGAVLSPRFNGLIRARGSSFEHPMTRAFVKAMIQNRARLEEEHTAALRRTAEAELAWQGFTKGTPIEMLFGEMYAGLFRNPKAKPQAAREIYGAHLYPVFSEGRCRLNVTGLPSDSQTARQHVKLFAEYCL